MAHPLISQEKGSTGSEVKLWQELLVKAGFPVPVTSVFDDATDDATRAWQASKGLLVDGKVGDASWSTMTGTAQTPAVGKDNNAKYGRDILLEIWPQILDEAATSKYPEVRALGLEPLTLGALQIFGAMADLEGTYGKSPYTNKLTGEKAVLNNWGAVQAGKPPCNPATSFEVSDSGAEGSYNFCYKKYPTPQAGALDFLRLLTVKRPASWAHALRGDIDAYSVQMHSWTPPLTSLGAGKGNSKHNLDPITQMPGYFEQPPLTPKGRAYGLAYRAANIANTLGEPLLAKRGGPVNQGETGTDPGNGIPSPFDPGDGGVATTLPTLPGSPAVKTGLIALFLGAVGYGAYRLWKGGFLG